MKIYYELDKKDKIHRYNIKQLCKKTSQETHKLQPSDGTFFRQFANCFKYVSANLTSSQTINRALKVKKDLMHTNYFHKNLATLAKA